MAVCPRAAGTEVKSASREADRAPATERSVTTPDTQALELRRLQLQPGMLTLARLEGALGLIRWGLILITLVGGARSVAGATGLPWPAAAGAGVYGVLLFLGHRRGLLPRLYWPVALADCALIGLATAATGGMTSGFQTAFFPVIFAAGMRLGPWQLATVLAAAELALGLAMQAPLSRLDIAVPWLGVLALTALAGAGARSDCAAIVARYSLLQALHQATTQLHAVADKADLAQATARACSALLDTGRVRLFAFQSGSLVEIRQRTWGMSPHNDPLPRTILERALHERQPQWWIEPASPGSPRGWTCLALPLIWNGAALGVLEVSWDGHAPARHRARETLAQQLSIHVAIALAHVYIHEQARQGAERLAYLGRHKSEFVAMLSHELRTPLTAIKGFAQLLRRTQPASTELVNRYTSIIEMESNHLIATIDDIVHLTNIEEGLLRLRRERVDVRVVLEQALVGLKRIASVPEFRYTGDSRPVWTVSDPARLEEALRNLLFAAIKYRAEPARAEGERYHFDIGVMEAPEKVLIWLADTAPGLHRSYHLLRELETAPQEGRSLSGSGLSLYIAKYIIQALGGSLAIGPYRGGTRYVVRLPKEG